MLRKIFMLFFMIFMFPSAICLASLIIDDYSPENFSFNVNLGVMDNEGTADQLNASYSITADLGSGFTGQYIYNDLETKITIDGNKRIKSKQINLLKNERNGISFLLGSSQNELVGYSSHTSIIAGIQGRVSIAPNTHAYAAMTTGNSVEGYAVGIGYNLTPNTELRLDYSNMRYKDLATEDITVKVPYGGIVYWF
ncbi:hypothetical protein SPSIL_039510 [Sporomusa silvacetica DSM 10669]|uniref:Outer membrane protein beta-barrel domain-containing protein n=1 Tax=Sporomusa silvacetica DSM 10669 TaxID=1123289 RepID=A0ABZ3IPX1_9FIRM|nr:hypothetical protein [Sporomusa silvacetica]OZC13856.1 hypothetical protein SPSIL_51840 [Sporomusa silvacetica DSM 10669]